LNATTLAVPNIFHQPCGVVPAPDGTLYVSDDFLGGIFRVDAQGNQTLIAGAPSTIPDGVALHKHLVTPCGIALDSDGLLVVPQPNELLRIHAVAGTVTSSAYLDDEGQVLTLSNTRDVAVSGIAPGGSVEIVTATSPGIGMDGTQTSAARFAELDGIVAMPDGRVLATQREGVVRHIADAVPYA
jgi:glucose/arabinose dehydrogenase